LWQMWTMPQAGIEIQVQKEASLVYLLAGWPGLLIVFEYTFHYCGNH
jgi:hypothetical protein